MNFAALRFLLPATVTAVILSLYLTVIRDSPFFVFPLVCGAATLGALLVLFTRRLGFAALGAAVCLLPALGVGALSVFVASWLIAAEFKTFLHRSSAADEASSGERLLTLAFLLLLLSLLPGLLGAVRVKADVFILSSLFNAGGAFAVLRYLEQSFSEWRSLLLLIAGYVLLALLALSLSRAERREQGALSAVLSGLAFGAFGATVVLLLQLSFPLPIVMLNHNAFWQYVGRYSASFSDPNAFGLMAALLIPMLFLSGRKKTRLLYNAAAFLLLCVSPWSGSRTIWIAFFLWFVLLLSGIIKRGSPKKFVRPVAFVTLLLPLLAFVTLGYPPLNDRIEKQIEVPGLKRALKSLDWSDGSEMLDSRVIYGRIASAMWKEHPWFGVGLERFYALQDRTAKKIGIDLEGWRDNANNYYLQVLSEQGVVGLLLTLFSFYVFAQALSGPLREPPTTGDEHDADGAEHASRLLFVSRTSLGVLLLLLLTGPHFFFEEVRFLTVILLTLGVVNAAQRVEPKKLQLFKRILISAAIICPLIYGVSLTTAEAPQLTQGLYAKEHGEDGFFAWTSGRARFALCATQTTLRIKALNPDLVTDPVTVGVFKELNGEKLPLDQLVLDTKEWVTLELELPSEDSGHVIVLEVSRTWSPNRDLGVGDWRELGVMLQWPAGLCSEEVVENVAGL